MTLDSTSVRVLGALMEKEMTTPDAYPLSISALVSASNQRSSRDPVMQLTEEEVRSALSTLETHGLVTQARDGSRVPRFEHRIRTVLNLRRDETAVICLLLLRGAQTPGELRSRAERMHDFEDIASVQATLDRLATRESPLVSALPRAPGSREMRSVCLLGATWPQTQGAPLTATDELAGLTALVHQLEARVEALEQSLLLTTQDAAATVPPF